MDPELRMEELQFVIIDPGNYFFNHDFLKIMIKFFFPRSIITNCNSSILSSGSILESTIGWFISNRHNYRLCNMLTAFWGKWWVIYKHGGWVGNVVKWETTWVGQSGAHCNYISFASIKWLQNNHRMATSNRIIHKMRWSHLAFVVHKLIKVSHLI